MSFAESSAAKKASNTLAFSASSVYIFPPLGAADQSFLSLPLAISAITEGFPVAPYSHSLAAFPLPNNVLLSYCCSHAGVLAFFFCARVGKRAFRSGGSLSNPLFSQLICFPLTLPITL